MLLGETINILKISDFGLAKPDAITTEKNTCFMGTIVYMAPEAINDQGVNSAADVYSLGISTWEMFHRKKPFYEHNSLSAFSLGISIINGTRPKIELRMEEEMKNLILRSLEAQSKLRPKANDFTTIAVKLKSETNVSSNAPKAQKAFAKRSTPPSRPLSSEIQNSSGSELTLLIGGYRDTFDEHETILAFEHSTKTWKELDVEIDEFVNGAVVLDEELYAFAADKLRPGGLFKLNPLNRSWIELTHLPNGSPKRFQSVAYRSKIYVVVREDICEAVLAFDPVENSWNQLARIKEAMIIEGITVLNDKLYIFGRDLDSRIEAGYYDTMEDEWTYLNLDFTVQFSYIQAVTYKNEVVFFDHSDVYASNLAVKTPLKKLPRLKPWRYSAAVFTCGNSLFVAGGNEGISDFSLVRSTDKVESFDGTAWNEMPCMPYELNAHGTVTVTGDLAKQLLKWSC